MANTVTNNELNVVQGFGERQLLRNLKSTLTPSDVGAGSLVKLDSNGDFVMSEVGDVARVLFVTQNNADNLDAFGTEYNFIGADAKVIGIPVTSCAEVVIPVASTTGFAIGGTVEAGAGVIAVGDGTVDIGLITDVVADESVTVLLG